MEFSRSPRCQELREKLTQFMDDHVYPAEAVYEEQLAAGDPHGHPPIMEELKSRAREEGLWNLFLPDDEGGPVDHPAIATLFEGFDEGRYQLRPEHRH